MYKHFLLTIFLFSSFAVTAQTTDPFIADVLSKWKGMKSYTLAVAELMPESNYAYKPVPEEFSFAEQQMHIAGNLYALSAKLIRGVEPPFSGKQLMEKVKQGASKKELIETLGKAFDYAEETFAQMTAKTLAEEIDYWGGHSAKRKIVLLLNDHQTHHRAQMIVYLRLNGIKPPAYIGW